MAISQTNYQPAAKEGLVRRIINRLRRKKETETQVDDYLTQSPDVSPRTRDVVRDMRKQGMTDDEISKFLNPELQKKFAKWKESRGSR